jgi:hypothetical protein
VTRVAKLLAGIALASTLLVAPAYAETGAIKTWPKAEAIKRTHREIILDEYVQSFPQFMFIGGAVQPQRATLIGSEGAGTTSSAGTRTATLTVPSGTTLMVVYFACRHGANASEISAHPTFNSVPMAVDRPVAQYQTRLMNGFFYMINPSTGAQTFSVTVNVNFSNSYVHAWYFGGNIYKPMGTSSVAVSISTATHTCTQTCSNDLPFVIAGAAHAHASGTGSGTWTGGNLTIRDNAGVASNNAYAVADNSAAVAGSTGYTMTNTAWGASYMIMYALEIRRVYAPDVSIAWIPTRGNSVNGNAPQPTSFFRHPFVHQAGSASDLSEYTFANVKFHMPHPNRKIWAVVWIYDATDPGGITLSGTIGGEAFTAVLSGNSSTATGGYTYLIEATVPDGVTGSIVITTSAAVDSCDILVMATYNYSGTLRDSVVQVGYSMANLDVATGDFGLCAVNGASDGTGFGNAPNWTGTSTWGDLLDEANSGATRRMGLYVADITETNDTNDLAPTGGGTANNCFAASIKPA